MKREDKYLGMQFQITSFRVTYKSYLAIVTRYEQFPNTIDMKPFLKMRKLWQCNQGLNCWQPFWSWKGKKIDTGSNREVRKLTSTWTSLQDSKMQSVTALCWNEKWKELMKAHVPSACLGKFWTSQITTAKELVSVSIILSFRGWCSNTD